MSLLQQMLRLLIDLRHGRWKSGNAKDGYIKDNILSMLSVSLSLGI